MVLKRGGNEMRSKHFSPPHSFYCMQAAECCMEFSALLARWVKLIRGGSYLKSLVGVICTALKIVLANICTKHHFTLLLHFLYKHSTLRGHSLLFFASSYQKGVMLAARSAVYVALWQLWCATADQWLATF